MSATRLPALTKQFSRATLRCDCGLVQFESKSGKCVKCGVPYCEAKEVVVPITAPVVKPERVLVEVAPVRDIGERLSILLKLLRTIRSWSQGDMGKAMGVQRTYISKLDCGRTTPTLKQFYRLCVALDVTPYGLLLMAEAIQ